MLDEPLANFHFWPTFLPRGGRPESAMFVANRIAQSDFGGPMFVEFPALLDWLNGKLDERPA